MIEPTLADLHQWLVIDNPEYKKTGIDFKLLANDAYKELLLNAKMPIDERGCCEIIRACIEFGLPTFLQRFLEHSKISITSLNITFEKLDVFDFDDYAIFNEALARALVDGLFRPHCKEVRMIALRGITFESSKCIELLFKGMNLCTALETVVIEPSMFSSDSSIWNPDAFQASRHSVNHLTLQRLSTFTTLSKIAEAIESMPVLRELRLSKLPRRSEIYVGQSREDAADAIGAALKKNPPLQILSLSSTRLRFTPLFKALVSNTNLKTLDLSRCIFPDDADETALFNLIGSNTALTTLSIGGVTITEDRRDSYEGKIQPLIKALMANKTLEV